MKNRTLGNTLPPKQTPGPVISDLVKSETTGHGVCLRGKAILGYWKRLLENLPHKIISFKISAQRVTLG